MLELEKLYSYVTKYEKEKLFIEAKIEVIKEMIKDEEIQKQEVVETTADEDINI